MPSTAVPLGGERVRQPREVDRLPGAAGRVGARDRRTAPVSGRHNRPARRCRRRRGAAEGGGLGAFAGRRLRLDRRARRWAVWAAPIGMDFNGFDAALCDALAEAVLRLRCLRLLRFLGRGFGGLARLSWPRLFGRCLRRRAVLAPTAVFAADVSAAFPEEALEDFLRVFLDIRLPFVAFGGSTNRVLRVSSADRRIRSGGWASLMTAEYGYKEFDAPPVCSLTDAITWAR